MSSALIPHPELFNLYPPMPEIADERLALRIGAAFSDGAFVVMQRLSYLLGGDRGGLVRQAIAQQLEPSYARVRDYLHYDNNVPLVLAARVALRLTTPYRRIP